MKRITSRENPNYKALRALNSDPRRHREEGRTLLDGPHLIQAYLDSSALPIMVAVSDSGMERPEIHQILDRATGSDLLQFPDVMFRELSVTKTPVGILACISIPNEPLGEVVSSCIVLDAIQDGGNLGTLLRTAAAAGIKHAILGTGCASPWAPKVLRAGQGGHFHLKIRDQVDLVPFLKCYKGVSIATMAHNGTSLYQTSLKGNLAWIFGNEGKGIRTAVAALADLQVTIPIVENCESLNVTSAAAICLFEAVRQARL